ncbi:hypothetical protein BSKO_10876 [Bryopsis sp. KO-2023]|nr:hypothetical protein BSKO_10876 [Bryopsis sp. KO-2023]
MKRYVLLFGFAFLCCCVAAQPKSFGQGREEKAPAKKSDIKYIRCAVCQNLIREASRLTKRLRDDVKPGKQVREITIMEATEKLCDPEEEAGTWIAKTDLVESDTELKLVDMPQIGDCQVECRTIARVCSDLLEDFDMDLAEALFKGFKRAELTSKFCYNVSDACKVPTPKLPKNRPRGEEFKVLSEKDIEMKNMLKKMKDSGMGGQVFDRESMMEKMGELEDQLGLGSASENPPPVETKWMEQGVNFIKLMYEEFSNSIKDIWSKLKKQYGSKRPEL